MHLYLLPSGYWPSSRRDASMSGTTKAISQPSSHEGQAIQELLISGLNPSPGASGSDVRRLTITIAAGPDASSQCLVLVIRYVEAFRRKTSERPVAIPGPRIDRCWDQQSEGVVVAQLAWCQLCLFAKPTDR